VFEIARWKLQAARPATDIETVLKHAQVEDLGLQGRQWNVGETTEQLKP
jgi:hypothetical protein